MIFLDIGKRKFFSCKSAKPLAQHIILALDMRRLSRVFFDASVIAAKKYFGTPQKSHSPSVLEFMPAICFA
jgi:hypothetical protein